MEPSFAALLEPNLDLAFLVLGAAAGGLYGRGTVRLWRRNGAGRGVRLWQATCFAMGLALTLCLLAGPLGHPESPGLYLDVTRRVLLTACAAPLLVLGAPMAPACRGLPGRWRRAAVNWTDRHGGPLRSGMLAVAACTHAAALGLLFLPVVLQFGLTDPYAALFLDILPFMAALAFWSVTLPLRYAVRHPNGAAALFMMGTFAGAWLLASGLLGAETIVYPGYDQGFSDETWSALVDQQLSGIIIGVGGLAYLIAGFAMAGRWRRAIQQTEQSTRILADSLPAERHDPVRVAATPRT